MALFSGLRDPSDGSRLPGLRCQALKELLGVLRPGARHAVLDLGPPLAANLQYLAALSCRVRIADLFRSLSVESVESRRPEAVSALFGRLLPLAPGDRFDALLAWDVFDYMRPDEVAALMGRLAPACPPETPVLVLASTGRTIPATPLRYRILDPENLACEGPMEPTRPCPRYTQPDFRRMMAGFSIRRSILMRSGLHEYLFVRDAGDEVAASAEAGAARSASRPPWFRRGPV